MANRLIQNLIVAIIGIMSVPSAMAAGVMDMPLRPRVFEGYRELQEPRFGGDFPDPKVMAIVAREYQDSVMRVSSDIVLQDTVVRDSVSLPSRDVLPVAFGSVTPDWLEKAIRTDRFERDFIYRQMLDSPTDIEYAYWKLPARPKLPEDDMSLRGFMENLELPTEPIEGTLLEDTQKGRINWLHNFNIGIQLSQAFVSANWYQGGNSHLAFLGNFLWDVQLNNVYYPKLIFQSTVSYKLGLNSTPDDEYHKYSVSQDLFQYNIKLGYKAFNHWYYSFLGQFKTQFLNSYPADSMTRSASLLSPGELNLGLGMTYSKEKENKKVKFSASISPISYNMKTCIDDKIDRASIGMEQGQRLKHEYGSNAEVNFYALMWGNTSYTTKMFFFSDYKSLQWDWENTLNFQFSKLFSAQVYAHLRYDTKAEPPAGSKWRKLMLKEILSVGISYTFSTK